MVAAANLGIVVVSALEAIARNFKPLLVVAVVVLCAERRGLGLKFLFGRL